LTDPRTILVAIFSRFPAWNIPVVNVDTLRQQFPRHNFLHARSTEEALETIAAAEIVFTAYLRRNVLAAAKNLLWIHSPAAGLEGLLFPEVVDSPVVVTNSRGLSADTIAEHVVAVVLTLFRKLPRAFEAQRLREWSQTSLVADAPLRTIAGSRVLIVGLGAIGMATATRMISLSAHVDVVRRRPNLPRPPGFDRVVSPDHLTDLLPSADVVVLAAPETSATHHLIGRRELAAMRPGAILVNVSRGTLVDEQALAQALTANPGERTVAAAALDVFEHEPLPAESPLWSLPSVLITPHVAGFRPDHWDAVTALFADNLRRYDSGQPLLNVVDKREGY
jgi:phosphoglycerate dehydrogenase-like enzyme